MPENVSYNEFDGKADAPTTNKYVGSRTEKNLETAFAGESMARNKYTYYASVATSSSALKPQPSVLSVSIRSRILR